MDHRLLLITAVLSLLPPGTGLNPSINPGARTNLSFEGRRRHLHQSRGAVSLASTWFDATYYGLNLRISTSPLLLSGIVTIRGISNADRPQFLTLDFMNSMHIDSVKVRGVTVGFYQQASSFGVSLDSGYRTGDEIALDVYYRGTPVATGFGSFIAASHSGIPWIWTLSEPYGARDWWPCKDHPSDKADSVDIVVTCDSSFSVGSNGKLMSAVGNADGTKTTHWKELYPIATYLVSVTLTNFAQFSNWFHYTPTDSMEVLNYVLPESLASAQVLLPRAVDGLRVFSGMFGLYPFVREKYGHSQFGFGGMEHQTMTSIGDFSEETVIHELAHQWFGDMISPGSWSHLWLNEGFAVYSTALYKQRAHGDASYRDFMDARLGEAQLANGPVFLRDTTDVLRLFANAGVYSKGACVLHMLRHVLGDSLFFLSMRAYANDSSLRYRTATTADFQAACERTGGRNLAYFFDEWIFGENYPHYLYSWATERSSGTTMVTLRISQTTGTTNPAFFTMPIDVRLSAGTWDSTIAVVDNSPEQTFSFATPHPVDSVQLDPDGWILKSALRVSAIQVPSTFMLYQNFPNPFNNATVIRYALPHRAHVNLSVFDMLGRRVATLVSTTQNSGNYSNRWDASGMPTGIYFYRFTANDLVQTGKMLLVR